MDKIYINDIIEKLNSVGTENNKDEFIRNFDSTKKEINEIDKFLENKNEFEDSNLNIQDLFNMLESYKDIINNENNLNIIIFKKILDLIECLEIKLEENNKLNITNIE